MGKRTRRISIWKAALVAVAVPVFGVAGWLVVDGGKAKGGGQPVGPLPSVSAPSVSAPPTALAVPAAPRIVYVGDSIAANWFVSAPAKGFRELLTARLHGRQALVIAHPGYTIEQSLPQVRAMRRTPADLAVVELGTNDVDRRVAVDRASSAYQTLLRQVGQATPGARLLCVGVWAPASTAGRYDNALADACHAAGGVFVPVAQVFDAAGTRGPAGSPSPLGKRDVFHPNDAGHAGIAAALAAVVTTGSA